MEQYINTKIHPERLAKRSTQDPITDLYEG